ncbi:MAG: hypothetical protein ABI986_08270 [Chloroflexota bacterium]
MEKQKPQAMKQIDQEIETSVTSNLSLRVSVATLVRVLFKHPVTGQTMLALERTATLRKVDGQPEITIRAKPFGGAVQITDPQALQKLIGDFQYDSERSHQEMDFRILIQPSAWEKVKQICHEHLDITKLVILDPSPERELTEEFEDTLRVLISQSHYQLEPLGIHIEDLPRETENVRAQGIPTVRLYYLFAARIESPEIIARLLANHQQHSDKDLENIAQADALRGGKGRANAILILGLNELKSALKSAAIDKAGELIDVAGHQLSRNVLVILEQGNQSV